MAIFHKLSTEGAGKNAHLSFFPWMWPNCIHYKLLPEGPASNFSAQLGPACDSPQRSRKLVGTSTTFSFWPISASHHYFPGRRFSHVWHPSFCYCPPPCPWGTGPLITNGANIHKSPRISANKKVSNQVPHISRISAGEADKNTIFQRLPGTALTIYFISCYQNSNSIFQG